MLLPQDDGTFICRKDDFKTENLFKYLDHFGVEYDWMVKLNPRYSFNLFTFLQEVTGFIEDEDYSEVWNLIQSVTLMLINASGEDFDEFVMESEVIAGTQNMFEQLERFMNDNKSE